MPLRDLPYTTQHIMSVQEVAFIILASDLAKPALGIVASNTFPPAWQLEFSMMGS